MSPKTSASDFGLYRNKQTTKIKYILITIFIIPLLIMIVYSLVHFFSSELTNKPKTAQLVQSASNKREIRMSKPFEMSYRGQKPMEFSSTTQRTTTERSPPNNIQDVIGQASSEVQKQSTIRYNHDPFYLYKPQDPGEINLLATANFRFAPPPWSLLRPHASTTQPKYYYDYTKRKEVPNLEVNVYPNRESEFLGDYGAVLKQFIREKIEGLRAKFRFPERKPKRMMLVLNLFPDDLSRLETNLNIDKVPSAGKN